MMRSLYSGVSGLKTHQTKMDVIGNNIANVNTLAFKSSSMTFADIMYQTTSGASSATQTTGGKNPNQIGLGVVSGSTKVSITAPGAAQSTGEGLDIKLTDTNSTNFFIVSNGSENLFTRAGSFYIDGTGNLAMTSTGFLVQGWQVDPNTGDIRKDTVSALRIMQAANLTSPPEATTMANMSGILDKLDTNVTSDNGYYRTLNFFDALGYSYSAKFSIKGVDTENGTYSIELVNIYDGANNDILADWQKQNANNTLDRIFGNNTTAQKRYEVDSKRFTVGAGGTISMVIDDGNSNTDDVYTLTADTTNMTIQDGVRGYKFTNTSTGDEEFVSLFDLYGVDAETVGDGTGLSRDAVTGELVKEYDTVNYTLQFNKGDGTFSYINSAGNDSVFLNMSVFGPQFENINVDFTECKNFENGGSSTLEMEKGDAKTGKDGVGKKLGVLTGVSVNGDGKIFGSYDNGNTVLLGQIAIAQFANASGLESLGNNCYATTLNSGEFDGIGVEVSADGGSMTSGQLEMSNVDLSTEFTDMITTQRGFQANSRIITTSDTLLEELVNLKR